MLDIAPEADETSVENAAVSLLQSYPQLDLLSFETLRELQVETIGQGMSIGQILLAILAVPSLLALANTITVNVLERTREIGVLRAIGTERGQVRRMLIAESLLLAILGAGCKQMKTYGRRKFAAIQTAIERVLGAAPGSLPLIDEQTLAAWFEG